jgi:hypothetical protein
MLWSMEKAADLMKFWRNFILSAPEDINGWFGFVTVPPVAPFPEHLHLTKMCAIVWCYTGPVEEGNAALQQIRDFGPPAVDFAGPIPWPALQSLFDALFPAGMQWYWKADFFRELTDAAIDLHVRHGAQLPTMFSTMHIYPINGAAQRVRRHETAFSFRDAPFAEVIVGVDPDPANNERMIQWVKDYYAALHPHSAGGAYINMIMDEGQETVRAAYRDNYDRLAQIKRRYDPTNLFHVNQNIQPAATGQTGTTAEAYIKTTIDLSALRTAIEKREADTLIGLYAEDAELKVMDKLHQPSHPLTFHGKQEVAGYLKDVCGREMTHRVDSIAQDGDTVAYSEACSYPDGTQVQSIAFLETADGKIVRHVGVQTWDE